MVYHLAVQGLPLTRATRFKYLPNKCCEMDPTLWKWDLVNKNVELIIYHRNAHYLSLVGAKSVTGRSRYIKSTQQIWYWKRCFGPLWYYNDICVPSLRSASGWWSWIPTDGSISALFRKKKTNPILLLNSDQIHHVLATMWIPCNSQRTGNQHKNDPNLVKLLFLYDFWSLPYCQSLWGVV